MDLSHSFIWIVLIYHSCHLMSFFLLLDISLYTFFYIMIHYNKHFVFLSAFNKNNNTQKKTFDLNNKNIGFNLKVPIRMSQHAQRPLCRTNKCIHLRLDVYDRSDLWQPIRAEYIDTAREPYASVCGRELAVDVTEQRLNPQNKSLLDWLCTT